MIKGTVTRDDDDNTRLDCITESVDLAWQTIRRMAQGKPFDLLSEQMIIDGEPCVCRNDLVLFMHVQNYPYYFELSYVQANGLPGLCILTVLVQEPSHHDNLTNVPGELLQDAVGTPVPPSTPLPLRLRAVNDGDQMQRWPGNVSGV